jgi:hypothetical protein
MRDHMRVTEKDTIDVVTYLKKQDAEKDLQVTLFVFMSNVERNLFD